MLKRKTIASSVKVCYKKFQKLGHSEIGVANDKTLDYTKLKITNSTIHTCKSPLF